MKKFRTLCGTIILCFLQASCSFPSSTQATAIKSATSAPSHLWAEPVFANLTPTPSSSGSSQPSTSLGLDNPPGLTYYIRADGGSADQCTGLADAPYPGSGRDQPCAWNHPFQALQPDGESRINGGDTLFIARGSYQMGYGAPGSEACDEEASYGCHMPPIPSGPDVDHPTRLLGAGWETGCTSPPELWGTGRSWAILNLTDSSNVEIACLEITDHSSCIEHHLHSSGKSPLTCQRDKLPYGEWASIGLYAEDSDHVQLKDLDIHGLADTGVLAGRLSDWNLDHVNLVGNGWSGWNGDIDGEDANTGTLTFRNWWVEWNGCGETYPDQLYVGCWGQEAGGYGDGVGTGTTGGHWIIEDSAFLHNTSDGLDLLYTRIPGSVIEIRRTIAAFNDGNQIKVTTGLAVIENTIVISQCGFFHDMPYWNNDDDCRAGGDAMAIALQPRGEVRVVNSTITGEGNCLVIAECALDQVCNGTEKILLRNTLFQGQKVFFNPEEDTCFAWYDDETQNPMPVNPFVVDYSLINGVRFGNVTPCPDAHNLCDLPAGIVNLSIGAFDPHLQAGSPAIDAGTTDGAPSVDFDNHPRVNSPDIGAYER